LREDVASVTRPVRELRGFRRVHLEPGETRTVRFELGINDLAFYDVGMRRVAEPGTFTVFVGTSSTETREARFELVTPGAAAVAVPATCGGARPGH
jgi:beta-glucosidase